LPKTPPKQSFSRISTEVGIQIEISETHPANVNSSIFPNCDPLSNLTLTREALTIDNHPFVSSRNPSITSAKHFSPRT
jgi:hypothetical protein